MELFCLENIMKIGAQEKYLEREYIILMTEKLLKKFGVFQREVKDEGEAGN